MSDRCYNYRLFLFRKALEAKIKKPIIELHEVKASTNFEDEPKLVSEDDSLVLESFKRERSSKKKKTIQVKRYFNFD